MASVLSATAKDGWEGGRRRGVKLAVAMGSHWLNMQCVEEGKNGSQLYTVCDFYLGGRRATTMASAFHTTGRNGWEGGWGRGVSDGTPMGSHWPHMQRVEEGKNGSQLYTVCQCATFIWGGNGPQRWLALFIQNHTYVLRVFTVCKIYVSAFSFTVNLRCKMKRKILRHKP